MAVTQARGSTQIKDTSVTLVKLVDDFLGGSDWNITNGANDAVITGLGTPTNAADAVNKAYVDGIVDSTLKAPDDYDASVGTYPTTYKGNAVAEGDTFYITTAGTMGTTVVNVGDLLVSKADIPGQTDGNWFVMESNRDQATEAIIGVAKIATQVITNAGTNDTDIVTPLKLATYVSSAYSAGNGIDISSSVISVVSDVTTGGDVAGASVTANGVGIDVTALDGDHLIVDFTPVNYTPASTPAESASVDDLAAHLYGVDQALAGVASKLTHYSNETPTVTNGAAAVSALTNLGSHATDKVANVEVYLNGIAQNPGSGNDYTLNATTGVITFEFNLLTGDVVLVHYDAKDA